MSKVKVIAGVVIGIVLIGSILLIFSNTEYKQNDVAACVISQILIEQNSQYKVDWDSSLCDKVIYNQNQTYLIHNHYYVGLIRMDYFMELYDNNGNIDSLDNWAILEFDFN